MNLFLRVFFVGTELIGHAWNGYLPLLLGFEFLCCFFDFTQPFLVHEVVNYTKTYGDPGNLTNLGIFGLVVLRVMYGPLPLIYPQPSFSFFALLISLSLPTLSSTSTPSPCL